MRVTHPARIIRKVRRDLPIREHTVILLRNPHPRPKMHLIDRDGPRRAEPLAPRLHPSSVMPFVLGSITRTASRKDTLFRYRPRPRHTSRKCASTPNRINRADTPDQQKTLPGASGLGRYGHTRHAHGSYVVSGQTGRRATRSRSDTATAG